MKVKIEDFLLAMGDYCREHSPEECASCKMSVDHEDPGDGTVFLWMRYVWMRVSKICQDGEKRNFEVHEKKGEKPMIKGKAKMEFGTGDIRMTGALSGGIGALCCITQEPHEIGEKVPVEDTWDTEQAEVILTFTKTESIDALIAELQDVKAMMNGSYPFENGRVMQKDLDFDAFIRREDIEDE